MTRRFFPGQGDTRGFSIIEAVITVFIVASGFLILFNVFSISARSATKSRNRLVAQMIANSLLEDVEAHSYGEPMPLTWTRPSVITAIIQGHKIQTTYNKDVTFSNGSFVGATKDYDYDKVLVSITWTEGTGVGGTPMKLKYEESTWVWRRAK